MTANPVGLPDLLSRLRSNRAQSELRAQLDRAGRELATGVREDRFAATGGDPGRLAALERAIQRAGDRQPLLAMAKARAETSGDAMEAVRGMVETLGVEALDTSQSGWTVSRGVVIDKIAAALDDSLATLNAAVGGRFVFGGAAAETPPFAGAEALAGVKADLGAAVAAAAPATSDALVAEVDAFFAANWSRLYVGEGEAPGVELGEGERLDYAVSGEAPAIRGLVRDLALGAWADELAAAAPAALDPHDLLKTAGERLLSAPGALADLRASLGLDEARIEQAEARAVGEKAAMETRRNALIAVDPYEAATRTLDLENRLEALYAVTARRARLSFLDHMR